MTVSHPIIPLKPIAFLCVPPCFFHLICKCALCWPERYACSFWSLITWNNEQQWKQTQTSCWNLWERIRVLVRAVLLFVSFYLRLSVSSLLFYFIFLHSMPCRLRGLVFHFLFNPTGFIKPNQMRALLIPLHLNRCGETSKRIFVCIRRRIILRNMWLHSARALQPPHA